MRTNSTFAIHLIRLMPMEFNQSHHQTVNKNELLLMLVMYQVTRKLLCRWQGYSVTIQPILASCSLSKKMLSYYRWIPLHRLLRSCAIIGRSLYPNWLFQWQAALSCSNWHKLAYVMLFRKVSSRLLLQQVREGWTSFDCIQLLLRCMDLYRWIIFWCDERGGWCLRKVDIQKRQDTCSNPSYWHCKLVLCDGWAMPVSSLISY